MNKQQTIEKAAAARHAAKLALARHALYATTFGGGDALTQNALLDYDVAMEAYVEWMRVASMHPSTRARVIRLQSLPKFMFGY